MAHILPFNAIIPPKSLAGKIATLPYDVMNRQEAKQMAEGNKTSFLHITRSEIDLPDTVDAYDPQVYEKALQNWQKLRDTTLAKDAVPAYYVYSLVMDGRRQTGIVATPAVDDYDNAIILKHEKTRKEKEDDRTRHITQLKAQTGPVFITYKDDETINAIVARTMEKNAPLFDFVAEDGISHTGWRIDDEYTEAIQNAFDAIQHLYIADGHHRAASASRSREALANAGESDRFLAVIFPASQLKILAYNRVVFNLNNLTEEEFLAKVKAVVSLTEDATPLPQNVGDVRMYFQGKWWQIQLPEMPQASTIEQLDVSRLQNLILHPILGIEDPRTSKSIDFVGGIRGTQELEKRVNSGEAKVAFSMYATTLQQLMDIADQGGIMPPKSTWFEPKLRDGLFVHEI